MSISLILGCQKALHRCQKPSLPFLPDFYLGAKALIPQSEVRLTKQIPQGEGSGSSFKLLQHVVIDRVWGHGMGEGRGESRGRNAAES